VGGQVYAPTVVSLLWTLQPIWTFCRNVVSAANKGEWESRRRLLYIGDNRNCQKIRFGASRRLWCSQHRIKASILLYVAFGGIVRLILQVTPFNVSPITVALSYRKSAFAGPYLDSCRPSGRCKKTPASGKWHLKSSQWLLL
jgi:hypothetical protein